MLVTFSVYLITHLILELRMQTLSLKVPGWLRNPYLYMMGGIFVLAMDFWNWEVTQPVFLGIPIWIWYFMGLSALQTLIMLRMIKARL
jgi:hypothetical protein